MRTGQFHDSSRLGDWLQGPAADSSTDTARLFAVVSIYALVCKFDEASLICVVLGTDLESSRRSVAAKGGTVVVCC